MSTNLNISLCPNEIVILKSIALGMSCQMIQRLLEMNSLDYQKICSSIFAKLNVNNSYAAVRIAYRKILFLRRIIVLYYENLVVNKIV